MDIHSDPLLGPLQHTSEGVRAGDCILVEKLGQGGMGAVYLGSHSNLQIEVAVKVLPFHAAAADSTAVSRFQKEARSAVRIDHPNIVRVYDAREERGVHYLVMEYVDGESAAARIERGGPLPERDALEIAIGAGEALSAAHAEGILHRDVKPANILIRFRDGRVKLADLGLAKALGGEGRDTTGLTATGQMLGTPAYMSPEQAEDASRTDQRTDIYSLGATLYALLSGKAPFEATQLFKLLKQVTEEEPEGLRELRPDVREETVEAAKKLMAKAPAQRPQTMAEAVGLLRGCLRGAPSASARGLARPEMAGRRKVKISAEAGTPTPAMPRTLDDVTPSRVRRENEKPEAVAPAAARRPAAVRTSGGKKLAIVLGIIAALGAAGGSAAYLYSQKRADDARLAEEESRNQAKVASLIATARTFREAGLLDKARDEAAEALSAIPDHPQAKKLLADIQSQIGARQNEAERATQYKRWTGRALDLRLSGKLEEAAQAYAKAAEYAPPGSREAAALAADCTHEHYKAQAVDAEAKGDLNGAVELYAKALDNKDDPATRRSLAEAKKKLGAKRAEEAKNAEAARWRSRAEEAERRGDLKAALGYYREAEKHGANVTARISSLTKELQHREATTRARSHVQRRAWKEAAAALEGVLRSRPGDRQAASLLAEVKKRLGPPKEITIELGGGVKMEMVYIRPGRFMMGSEDGKDDEKPVHEVVITRGFYLGKYEVTQEQYQAVMATNPSCFKGANNPVEAVSWYDAAEFCRKLTDIVGTREGFLRVPIGTFRLPTEAEWEYACRAGSTGKYCFGSDEGRLGEYAWHRRNASKQTHPVGQKRPNAWRLCDMHGNVWEWCADWYDKAYYGNSAREDPKGPTADSARVLRGGSWYYFADDCRSADRYWVPPSYRSYYFGFRAAADATPLH